MTTAFRGAARSATAASVARSASRQLCTFQVERLALGLDVRHVQEVLRFQEMTRVPLAPPAIRGLINLRGQIVTALDLRCRLGLPLRRPDERPMNIVVRHGDGAVSLLVDRIGDVLEIDSDVLESPPSTIRPSLRAMLVGVAKLPSGLLLEIDPVALLRDGEPHAVEARLAAYS